MRALFAAGWLGAFLAPLLFWGCAGRPAPGPGKGPLLSRGEDRRLLEGARLLREGKPGKALALAERLLRGDPWFVEAHRLRQNAMMDFFRSGPMHAEYGRLAKENPDRAEAWYLLGRISFPLSRQISLFRKALSLNPAFPRAWGGLGWALFMKGDLEGARKALSRALALDPGQADFHLAMARILFAPPKISPAEGLAHLETAARLRPSDPLPRFETARRMAGPRGLLAEVGAVSLEPESPLFFQVFPKFLGTGDAGAAGLLRCLLEREEASLCPEGVLWLARLRARAGEAQAALQAFRKARAGMGRLDQEDRVGAATLLFSSGKWKEGLGLLLRWRPSSVPLRGPSGQARVLLERALEGKDSPDPGSLAGLLAQAGWIRPAAALAGWIRSRGGVLPGRAEKALARGREVLFLEGILKQAMGFTWGARGDLAGLLERLRRYSKSLLGKDVVGHPRLVSVTGIGVYLDPTGPGLPSYFRKRGRLLLLGQRLGRRPQAYSGRILTQGKERLTLEGRSRVVTYWLVDGAGLEPADSPFDLAGLALDRFYMVDLEAIRRWALQIRKSARAARAARALDQPLAPPEGPEGIYTPSDLAAKCRVLGLERKGPPLEERLYEIVRVHELGHLADAAWFLPPLRHLGRVARLLFRCDLSPARVQAELERRAQAYALARAGWPFLALAQTAGALPRGADLHGEPHEVGYALLVRDLARRAAPFLRGGDAENPAAALFRLNPEELTAAARAVLKDMELAPFHAVPLNPPER